jgi:hypothetical protein
MLPGEPKSTGTGAAASTAANVNEPVISTPPLASPLWRRCAKRLMSRGALLVLLPAFLAVLLSIAIVQMFSHASIPPVRTGQIQIEEIAPQSHAELGIEPVQPVQPAKPRLSARTHAVPSSRHNPGPSPQLPCRRRSC